MLVPLCNCSCIAITNQAFRRTEWGHQPLYPRQREVEEHQLLRGYSVLMASTTGRKPSRSGTTETARSRSSAAPALLLFLAGARSTTRHISPRRASAAARAEPGCAAKKRARSSAGQPIRVRAARLKRTTGTTRSCVATERSRR